MVRCERYGTVRLTAPVMKRALGTAFLVLIAIACGPTSVATTQRTPAVRFVPAYQATATSPTVLCGAGRFIPSVVGSLAGDPRDPALVWLVGPDGQRIEVRWPPQFHVVFKPALELIDGSGAVVVRAGERVDINVNPATHAGSRDDPYRASQFNDRCFAPPVTP